MIKFKPSDIRLYYKDFDYQHLNNQIIITFNDGVNKFQKNKLIFDIGIRDSDIVRTYIVTSNQVAKTYTSDIPLRFFSDFENELDRLNITLTPANIIVQKEYVPILIPDNNVAITKFGIYLDNDLIFFLDHNKKEIYNSEFRSKRFYSLIVDNCQSLGYSLNTILDLEGYSMSNKIKQLFYSIQNRLDI